MADNNHDNFFGDLRKRRQEILERLRLGWAMSEIQDYCALRGYGFLPVLIEDARELPQFSDKVEVYIMGHARDDLPESQFNPSPRTEELSDFLEVGGLVGLGYCPGGSRDAAKMQKLAYHHPNEPYLDLELINPVDLTKELAEINLGKRELRVGEKAEDWKISLGEDIGYLVGWHTQSRGVGQLTHGDCEAGDTGDVDAIKSMLELAGDRQYYHVIYQPRSGRFFWYMFEKVPPTVSGADESSHSLGEDLKYLGL